MLSVNVITSSVVLKILCNTIFFPCKSLCLQVTADETKSTKNNWSDLAFIFTKLSDHMNSFVKISWPNFKKYC